MKHHWDCQRPLDWEPYSKARLEELVDSNHPTLVFVAPQWSIDAQVTTRLLDRPEVQYLIRSRGIKTLIYTLDDHREERLREFIERADVPDGWYIKTFCLAYFAPKDPKKTEAIIGFNTELYNHPDKAIAELIR